jgi:thiamine kinase-like enzyme
VAARTTPTIEQVIAAIPDWAGRAVSAQPVAAGLTNRNYRVEVDGTPLFVRIPGAATELLAVDRANELHNTRAAAEAGVGPAVLHHLPAWDVFVLGWVDARTMSNEAFAGPDEPHRVADVLRRLHAGPRFRDDFDMFRTAEYYLRVVDERSIRVPAGYREHLDRIPRIRSALAARPLPTVPCHNDLLADNYLDDGRRLWIVDYEYSGNNDPTFELGNTCQELGWDDGRIRALCAAYFGQATDSLLARMRLQMIMSDVGWTLWAAIQAAISSIDYDFWGWAEERWARAATAIGGTDFEDWLAAVQGEIGPAGRADRADDQEGGRFTPEGSP